MRHVWLPTGPQGKWPVVGQMQAPDEHFVVGVEHTLPQVPQLLVSWSVSTHALFAPLPHTVSVALGHSQAPDAHFVVGVEHTLPQVPQLLTLVCTL